MEEAKNLNTETAQNTVSDWGARAIDYVPTVLAVLTVLLIGWVVARFLAALARRLARRLQLDDIVQRTELARGMEQAKISRSASELIGILVFWLVFLSFVLVALENLGLSIAILPLQGLIGFLPRLLAAILILVVGAFLAEIASKATQATSASMGVEFHRGLGKAARALVLITAVIIAVDQLGLNVSLLTSLVINTVTIIIAGLALAFGLGGRDIARNVLAGYYARDVYQLGDRLVIDGQEGALDTIGTLNAEIVIPSGRLVIPNTRLTESKIEVLFPSDVP
jgi:small-conductance mechanosensitive channel